ncbi:MAG TPA: cobalamin-dependent protein [Bryobacteraceae bacterium]|nr:cobalamin-dependent protein [Bryobacteraceae bacterium]
MNVCERPPSPATDAFLTAILLGHRHGALSIVEDALIIGWEPVDIYVEIIADALCRVGELWEQNVISVAQEHMATAVTQYAIASIYPKLLPAGPSRGEMVVTGVAGELHQIGANLVADAMESKGWSVRFLGSNTPLPAILEIIRGNRTEVLCISTTLVSNLPAAAELIRSLANDQKERGLRIVLGGAAFRHSPQFLHEFQGCVMSLDLREALALLCI